MFATMTFAAWVSLTLSAAHAQSTVEFGPTYLPERAGNANLPPTLVAMRVSAGSAPTRAQLVELIDELVVAYGGADIFAGLRASSHGTFAMAQRCESLRSTSGLTLPELESMGGEFDTDRELCLTVNEGGQDYLIRLAGNSMLMFYNADGVTSLQEEPTRQEHWLLPSYLFGQAVYAVGCSTGDDTLRFGLDDCRRLALVIGEATDILEAEPVHP